MCGSVWRVSKRGSEQGREGERGKELECEAATGKTKIPGGAATSMEGKPSSALLVQAQSDASGGTAERAR